MKTVIVQYNAGNVRSVQFALERMGVETLITGDADEIRSADKVIFPGVGEASSAMRHLNEAGLIDLIPSLKQPVLGICLGMQLLCRRSEEGNTDGLGIFPVDVLKFIPPAGETVNKVPHMGWNTIHSYRGRLFKGLPRDAYVYYVHSYYVPLCDETAAVTDYIHPYSAALEKDNFYAVQFHPEKSGVAGEFILRNFLQL